MMYLLWICTQMDISDDPVSLETLYLASNVAYGLSFGQFLRVADTTRGDYGL